MMMLSSRVVLLCLGVILVSSICVSADCVASCGVEKFECRTTSGAFGDVTCAYLESRCIKQCKKPITSSAVLSCVDSANAALRDCLPKCDQLTESWCRSDGQPNHHYCKVGCRSSCQSAFSSRDKQCRFLKNSVSNRLSNRFHADNSMSQISDETLQQLLALGTQVYADKKARKAARKCEKNGGWNCDQVSQQGGGGGGYYPPQEQQGEYYPPQQQQQQGNWGQQQQYQQQQRGRSYSDPASRRAGW